MKERWEKKEPKVNWPNKEQREKLEIRGFIEAYARLPDRRRLQVLAKGEKPDYRVRCEETGAELGVELTSVYLSDRSVPDEHIPSLSGPSRTVELPFDRDKLEKYKLRLMDAVRAKVAKARAGYDCSTPLLLAVYVNEYVGIHLTQNDLEDLAKRFEADFDCMAPFTEVIFWNLPNEGIFQVRPGQRELTS